MIKGTICLEGRFGEIIELAGAEVRINKVTGSKTHASARFDVVAPVKGEMTLVHHGAITFEPRMDGPNYIKQAYEALMGVTMTPEEAAEADRQRAVEMATLRAKADNESTGSTDLPAPRQQLAILQMRNHCAE